MTLKIPVIMVGTVQRLFFAAAVLALASGGCATGHAKTAPVPTPLDVPAPPPRIIGPPGPEASTPPPATDADPNPQKPPRPLPPPKLDTPRPAGPPVVTGPPVVAAPPAATLQQTQPGKAAGPTAQQVSDQLKKAEDDLQRVNPRALNPDAKSQYDTAQRFVVEARQALKEGNLVFAAKVAEKAAGLAAGLPVR
jgi:hypothetical protein